MLSQPSEQGFSLVELLVTLVILSLLVVSLLATYVTSAQRSQGALNVARLDQSLQRAMSLMSNDIRRAGFWGNATSGIHSAANNNPFMTTDISINGAGDCILFAYDQDGDGTLPSIGAGSDDERYGYRVLNNIIQARPTGASYDCSAAASAWENITDVNVLQVTALTFVESDKIVLVGSGTPTMKIRSITISMTGRLTSDNSVTKTLTEQVRVRNDKYAA